MKQQALAYLEKDKLLHMDMIFPIHRGTAEIIYAAADGVFIREQESSAYMLSVNCPQKGRELLDGVGRQSLYCVHQKPLADYLLKRYNMPNHLICRQAVYLGQAYVETTPSALQIKKLDLEHADLIFNHYHKYVDFQYLCRRLAKGAIYGGFLGDELCGFVGTHEEGSIGILEVFERYRRRGYAKALESHLINLFLDHGQTPFAQISIENESSINLHRKLGFEISPDTLHWLFK